MTVSSRSRIRFSPPWWAWIAWIPATALLLTLGTWQLHRGQQKVALQTQFDRALQSPAIELQNGASAPPVDGAIHARASGAYDSARQMLLDNQSDQGRPGYHVLTPLRLSDGSVVVVDRGWVAQTESLQRLPEVSVDGAEREIAGLWRPLIRPGLRLAVDNCAGSGWPRVLQYPEVSDLRCVLGESVLPGVLLLDPQAPDGYLRDWRVSTGFPPERHYAYAAQWYAFAATLLFFFIKLNLKRSVR